MENITIEDIDAILRVIYLRNKTELDGIKKDAQQLRKCKDKQRNDRLKKDESYFKSRERIQRNKYRLLANKKLLFQLREKGISMRKILNLFLKKWGESEYRYLSSVIFND